MTTIGFRWTGKSEPHLKNVWQELELLIKCTLFSIKIIRTGEIYALNVAFLNSLIDIDKVIYAPVILDVPEKGRINNPAHSLVVFSLEFSKDQAREPETLLKIRDHAKNRRVEVNKEKVEELVNRYRNL